MRFHGLWFAAWTSIAAVLATGTAEATTTILVGGRIHTLDPSHPDASAMAWEDDGRIVAVGERAEIEARFPGAPRVDAGGATVLPGLIDAHGHVLGLGFSLLQADVGGARSKGEVVDRLRRFAADLPKGEWLLGRGWDQNLWPEKAFPTAADLDEVFPDRPVWLRRVDGHAAWANTAALRLVKRDLGGDWQPPGGRIERKNGKATGVFVDGATSLVEAVVPHPSPELTERAYRAAFAEAVRQGLTGVHDAGVSLDDLRALRKLADAGELPLRIAAMADGDHAALAWLCKEGRYAHPSGRLQMRAVKLYADGALGSRGAALLADYTDDPGNRGLFLTAPDAYRRAVQTAARCGVQVATHAIGDRGNRLVLDTYAAVLGAKAAEDHRWRVEHAQIVALEDIPRFAQLHLVASMQPTHATSDMPWAEARVGPDRIRGAYAWQRFIAAGVPLALGSDFPVEHVSPMLGIYAAVTRKYLDGSPPRGWLPDQRLSRQQAVLGFTRDAARAAFMENEVGTLRPGLRADFVILDADPLTVQPARRIAAITVKSTWVDGKPVYRAP